MNFAPIDQVTACASTQDTVRNAALAGCADGYTYTARRQTAGRGRRGRNWLDDDVDALMWSTWVPWPHPPARAPMLSILAGLALAEALDPWLAVGLKWPNDILAPDRRKLAGILAEGVWDGSRLLGVVIGIGINVSWLSGVPPKELPGATAIAEWSKRPLERIGLITDWRRRLWSDVHQDAEICGRQAAQRFAARLLPDARLVRLKTVDADPTVGYIEGITAQGNLILRRASDGQVLTTAIGELDWADRPDNTEE